MPSTPIDSGLFRDLFGTPAMRAVFADEALLGRYAEAEAALARAEAKVGVIPAEAAAAIRSDVRMMTVLSCVLLAAFLLWRTRSLLPLLLLLLPLLLVAPATAALPLLSWPLALSSGTCRRIHNDANLNTTTTHLRPMPIALQHPPVASRHCASLARPSKNPPARQLRASFF